MFHEKRCLSSHADPTRREILNIIAHQSLNLNAVADKFDISRPAVSRHIKILTECGLIVIKKEGRERYCKADLRSLNQVSDWIEQYRTFWSKKLDALENFLTKDSSQHVKRKGRRSTVKSSQKTKRK